MKFVLFGGVCLFVFLGRTLCLILSQGSFLKKKNVFRKKHLSITTTRHPNHEGKTHLECSLSLSPRSARSRPGRGGARRAAPSRFRTLWLRAEGESTSGAAPERGAGAVRSVPSRWH